MEVIGDFLCDSDGRRAGDGYQGDEKIESAITTAATVPDRG